MIGDKRISVRVKGIFFKTVVGPAISYDLETVPLSKRQTAELNLDISLGVMRKDRIRNAYVRGTAKVEFIGGKVKEVRLMWFGYVLQSDMQYIG